MITIADSLLKYTDHIQQKIKRFADVYDALDTEQDMVFSKAILKDLTLLFPFQSQLFALATVKNPELETQLKALANTQEEIQDVIDCMVMLHADEPDREFIVRMEKIAVLMQPYQQPEYVQVVHTVGNGLGDEEQSAFLSKLAQSGVIIPEEVYQTSPA